MALNVLTLCSSSLSPKRGEELIAGVEWSIIASALLKLRRGTHLRPMALLLAI
jgi:hypothetical protein